MNTSARKKQIRLSILILTAIMIAASIAGLRAQTIVVPGTSNPWLAGMPDGSPASFGDVAPAESPVFVTGINLTAGSALQFTATGLVANGPIGGGGVTNNGPDGGGFISHTVGAENGIADATVNINALMGVFLDNSQPSVTLAPPAFPNSPAALTISPGLKQPFFIGDGLTGTGTGIVQDFVVPSGATRFYLGTMDGGQWNNNVGSFTVGVTAISLAHGSATWLASPTTGDWNTPGNWTPATVPNASTDTATFDRSNTTSVSISANTEVNGIVFNAAAAANPFTITVPDGFTLTISGVGITNNSGVTQNLGNFGTISFGNSATAGSMTAITNNGTAVSGTFGGLINFNNTSSAGSATITNNGGAVSGVILSAAATEFNNSSTAGSATIINNGSTVSGAGSGFTGFNNSSSAGTATITNNAATGGGTFGGLVNFNNTSSAGSATIINNGSSLSNPFTNGATIFLDSSTAGAATLIANGGTGGSTQGGRIGFDANSDGGTARVEVFGNGLLDTSGHNAPGVTIGSIEGNGNVFLGANNLTVGSNNQNTIFSGVMQDGGHFGGTGGSLTKAGRGTLDLTGVNTYTGNTNVNGGVLKVDGSITSNTFVNPSGTLAGTGIIHGTVANNGGTVSPGDAPGTLTVNGNYTQGSGGVLNIQLASPTLFSRLVITGNAILMPMPRASIRPGAPVITGANLVLDFIDGFAPTTGETFDFFSAAGGVTGTFSNTTIEGLEPGFMFTVSPEGVGNFDLIALNNGVSSVPDQGATFGLLLVALLGCALFHWHSASRRFV